MLSSKAQKALLHSAKAAYSLQDTINEEGVSEGKALTILHHNILGLHETSDIVHRDLKPDNVLFCNDKWQLADFGIAKFVEDSTSVNTLKDCLTPQYAAPEQWRLQSAVKATDVYALGCIAHTLLTGSPPFSGKDHRELRDKHLKQQPPSLNVNARIQQLVSLSLRKSPESRPSVDSLVHQIKKINANDANASSITKSGEQIAKKEADLINSPS